MLKSLRVFLALFLGIAVSPQFAASGQRYDLVIVISIDQFPYTYLDRFSQHFGPDGFNRFIRHGADFANARYGHAFLLTGPSHAVISTGCYPARSGIVGNNWHDAESGQSVYCVADSSVRILGATGRPVSPALLTVPTFGDELRMATDFRSRVISISPKDRSAILLGGKAANAAYWINDSLFVTSTYYVDLLPEWVEEFNRSGLATSYFGRTWSRLLPGEAYAEMDRDDAPYEGGAEYITAAFPHEMTGEDRTQITRSYFGSLWNSPFLNELTMAFTRKAVEHEQLGMRGETDILFIGLSANDAVGHTFGPHSHETLDITVRTDRLLAEFFTYVDEKIGLSNCLIALTSDHGIAPIPEYLQGKEPSVPSGRVGAQATKERCTEIIGSRYGPPPPGLSWVDRVVDGSIYLSRAAIDGAELPHAVEFLADSLRNDPSIAAIVTAGDFASRLPVSEIAAKMYRSYFPGRSGDLIYALKPYFIDYGGPKGTDHGQPYSYDDHVPLLLYGKGIRPGRYYTIASPADLAPTISVLLEIGLPPAPDGRVLSEALEGR